MHTISLQQFTQTIIDLCRLAATASDSGLVLDIAEECSSGIRVWTSAPDMPRRVTALDAWAAYLLQRLEYVDDESGVAEELLLRIRIRLLRLRAEAHRGEQRPKKTQPVRQKVETKKESPVLTTSQKKVLDLVRALPDVRTSELASRLRGRISERTIQRSLKELASFGMIDRIKHADGSVSYRILD